MQGEGRRAASSGHVSFVISVYSDYKIRACFFLGWSPPVSAMTSRATAERTATLLMFLLIAGCCAGAVITSNVSVDTLIHISLVAVAFIAATLWRMNLGRKFRVNRRLQFLFNSCMGKPGQGPSGKESGVSDTAGQSVTDQEYKTMQSMFAGRARQVAEADDPARLRLTKLSRLQWSLPARFVCFLAWSCCFGLATALTPVELYGENLRITLLPQADRKNEVLSCLSHCYRRDTDKFGLQINGWPVCEECFCGVLGVSKSDMTRMKRAVIENRTTFEHANTGNSHGPTIAGMETRVWMNTYFHLVGDYQPDTGQLHLSPMAILDVFDLCKQEVSVAVLEYSSFCRVFASEFSYVKIPSEKRLGKCEECKDTHDAILGTRDPAARAILKAAQRKHCQFVKGERLVYHTNRVEGREHPDHVLSVIIDGTFPCELSDPNTCSP